MKKSMLYTGIGYVVVGVLCFTIAAVWNPKISALLFGLGGAGVMPGLLMIWKYVHWTSPKNREIYAARMKEERILLHDERKIMLRQRTGWTVYLLMLVVYCLLMLVCALLSHMKSGANLPFSDLGPVGPVGVSMDCGNCDFSLSGETGYKRKPPQCCGGFLL